MAATVKTFLLIMLLATVVCQTVAQNTWYKQYYGKRLPDAEEKNDKHDNVPIKGNLAMFNPWISPLARKYRLMRLSRSATLSDGF
uniref:Uncharacterized protein n=1 Tax=Syphacia muris TaxID=451379 RepID=A0A0N5APP4_9BILA